ncbi:adenylate/guanylate cyclase domain-containing protein [Rhizobium herbae]
MPDKPPSALRAILFADAAEYTRHVQAQEQVTLDYMERCFAVFRDLAGAHGGEVLKTMGDGLLVEFASASASVVYALSAQDRLAALSETLPREHQIQFRIGIHLGEVQHRDGDVYGHIVNVASRLEHLAEPGGICISQAVFDQVRQSVSATYASLGRRTLKNMPQPVAVYRVHRRLAAFDKGAEFGSNRIAVSLIERVSMSDSDGNELNLKSIKARALVGYLVLNKHQRETKERILALLWSNEDSKDADRKYKSVIRQLRQIFQTAGSDAFRSNSNDVAVVLSTLQVDLLTLSQQLSEGSVAPELVEGQISPDHIMGDLEYADQVFDAWLKVTRHRWRDRLVEQLENCLDRFSSDLMSCKHAAIALLAIDPTHEPAACTLMRLYSAEGKSAAALRVYQSVHDVLAQDFGIEPAAETQNVMQLIRSERMPSFPEIHRVPADITAIEGRLPVIEVRPFLSNDLFGKEHLLAGFREEVISCLVKFRDWVVIEDQADKRSDGEKGVVDYRLEAHISASEDDMVNLLLADAINDRVVWSERYPLALPQRRGASASIAKRTAAVLDIYLSAERVAGHWGHRDGSLVAYDDWLRGENLLTMWQPEAEAEAELLFKSAISRMPRFAPAYSSLASVYNVRHLVVAGFRRDPALEAEALKLAQKAVQLDPLETRAHLTLAWSCAMAGRFEQADIHYDLAFDLNPNNPKTLLSCAHGLAYTGRVQRARELEELALGLTPIVAPYQWAYLAGIRFICGDYPGSVAAATMGTGSLVDTLAWKAAALSHMGEIADARRHADEFLHTARNQWTEKAVGDADIVAWILHGFPIKEAETRRRLTDGLELAGLPVNLMW